MLAKAASPIFCDDLVKSFLANPNERTLTSVSRGDHGNCWAALSSSNADFDSLIHSVERGNRWSAQYLAEHLKELDGGNLEDALVALGQFADHKMERMLRFRKDAQISDREFKDALTMLPLSLSDDPRGQLHALRTRRTNVMRVSQGDLADERAAALKAINESVSEVKSKAQQ